MSRLLTVTFTTAAFVRSSSRLFEASSYQTAPKGLPSSFVQHDAFASSRHTVTSKPANGTSTLDELVLPYRLARWQVQFEYPHGILQDLIPVFPFLGRELRFEN